MGSMDRRMNSSLSSGGGLKSGRLGLNCAEEKTRNRRKTVESSWLGGNKGKGTFVCRSVGVRDLQKSRRAFLGLTFDVVEAAAAGGEQSGSSCADDSSSNRKKCLNGCLFHEKRGGNKKTLARPKENCESQFCSVNNRSTYLGQRQSAAGNKGTVGLLLRRRRDDVDSAATSEMRKCRFSDAVGAAASKYVCFCCPLSAAGWKSCCTRTPSLFVYLLSFLLFVVMLMLVSSTLRSQPTSSTSVVVFVPSITVAAAAPLFQAVAAAAAAETNHAAGLQAEQDSVAEKASEAAATASQKKFSQKRRKRVLNPPRPLQIIRPNDRHTGFEIDEEALAYIEEIPAPLSVIAAVGSIHTGKSFFLSQLLAFSSPTFEPVYSPFFDNGKLQTHAGAATTRLTAFPVGYTVQPGTQGISIWSEPLRIDRRTGQVLPSHNTHFGIRDSSNSSSSNTNTLGAVELQAGQEDLLEPFLEHADSAEELTYEDESAKASSPLITNVLLLDTEGFGGPNVTRSYDQLLYAIASLSSSHILFTTMKMIDAQSLQLLEDLTKDANLFNLRAHAQALNDTAVWPAASPTAPTTPAGASTTSSVHSATSSANSRLTDSAATDGEKEEVDSFVQEGAAAKMTISSSTNSVSTASARQLKVSQQQRTTRSSAPESALFSSLAPCCLSWIVQDFAQDLEGLTAQEWLEHLLDTNRWSSSAAEVEKQYWREERSRRSASSSTGVDETDRQQQQRKKTTHSGDGQDEEIDPLKHSLRSFYESIDCVALPAPAANAEMLQRLDLLPLREMSATYKEAFEAFRQQLLLHVARQYKVKNSPVFSLSSSSCSIASSHAGDQPQKQQLLQCSNTEGVWLSSDIQSEKESYQFNNSSSLASTPMSGKDLAALLRFLVRAANLNMFEDVQIFMNHFSTVRSELAKNDLLLLFEEDMKRFLDVYPPPLSPAFFSFAEKLRQQLLQHWQQQTRGSSDSAQSKEAIKQQQEDLIKSINEKVDYFRSLAEEQVRQFCRSFCEKQLQEVQAEVHAQQQQLPMSPQALSEWALHAQRLHRTVLREEINRGGDAFSASDVCEEETRAFEERIETLFLYIHKENTKQISNHMQRAEEAATTFFAEQLQQHPLELLRPVEEFRVILFEWKSAAWDIFEENVDELRTVKEAYNAFEERLRTALKRLEQNGLQQWENKCTEVATDVLKKWTSLYKAEVVASFPKIQALPVDEEILASASQNKLQDALRDLTDLYCVNAPPWTKVYKVMKEVLHKQQLELEMQNVEAIKVTCKEPLDKLTKRLQGQASLYYLWGSFAELARREAMAILSSQSAQSKSAIILSDLLMKKVTEHWIDSDIRKAHAATIRKNFNNLLFQIFGSIFVAVGVAITAVWSFGGLPIALFGLWCTFGFATLLGWLREAFKFVVEGLWNGLQNRLGLEMAAGVCFLAAAVTGGLCWRWWCLRRAKEVAYATPIYQPTCSYTHPYSVDPMASYTTCGSQLPTATIPQQMEFQAPIGLSRCSVLPNSNLLHESVFPEGDRKSRYSTATYLGSH